MAKELLVLKGTTQRKQEGEIVEDPSTLYVTRFYGGKKGTCIQLTIASEDGYIHLTGEQVKQLADVLAHYREI